MLVCAICHFLFSPREPVLLQLCTVAACQSPDASSTGRFPVCGGRGYRVTLRQLADVLAAGSISGQGVTSCHINHASSSHMSNSFVPTAQTVQRRCRIQRVIFCAAAAGCLPLALRFRWERRIVRPSAPV